MFALNLYWTWSGTIIQKAARICVDATLAIRCAVDAAQPAALAIGAAQPSALSVGAAISICED